MGRPGGPNCLWNLAIGVDIIQTLNHLRRRLLMIVNKLASAFQPGEVLTILQVADRTGYGLSTVSCYLPKMVQKKMLWRVAHGKYSLDPKPADLFEDQEAILKAVAGKSYWTSQFARQATGMTVKEFCQAMYKLQLRGVVKPIRKGVYAVFKYPRQC